MPSFDEYRIRQVLAVHYGDTLRWRFVGSEGDMAPDEFFSPQGFLPLFGHLAAKIQESIGVNALQVEMVQNEKSLLGLECRLKNNGTFRSLTLCLVTEAVEQVCGSPDPEREVDISALYEYLSTSPDARKEEALCVGHSLLS